MQRKFSFILAMLFSVMVLLPTNSEAKIVERMTAQISNDIIITVNGERVPFKAAIVNNTSYLPVRVIGYALNSEVDWIQSQKKITLDTKEARLPYKEFSDLVSINSGKRNAVRRDDMSLYLNDQYYKSISQQIIVIEDRSYLPIRAISESLGIRSTWNEKTKTIEIVNPRTFKISELDKPYYIKDLPIIKTQEDYLVGNFKGPAGAYLNGNTYKADGVLYISKKNNGRYKVVERRTVNNSKKYNGFSFVSEYDGYFNPENNTLTVKNGTLISNDFNFNIIPGSDNFILEGEMIYAIYPAGNSIYHRF